MAAGSDGIPFRNARVPEKDRKSEREVGREEEGRKRERKTKRWLLVEKMYEYTRNRGKNALDTVSCD